MAATTQTGQPAAKAGFSITRLLPLMILLAVPVLAWAFGLTKFLSFDLLAQYHGALKAWVADHQLLAVLGYTVFYAAATALSLPAGLLITVTGGLLFGWIVGGTATVVGATLGATGLFLVAKTSLGAGLPRSHQPVGRRTQATRHARSTRTAQSRSASVRTHREPAAIGG